MRLRLACGLNTVVTLGATINNSCMVEHANVPGKRRVARSAVIRRTDVVEGFAFRLLVVMALFARFLRHLVIELGDRPGFGHMAIRTGIGRFDVTLVLARGVLAIVAGKTFSGNLGMVDVHIAELRIAVAICANIRGLWVIVWLRQRHVTIVAAKACRRHTFEYSTFVALFTRHLDVGTIEREACELVVE